MPQYDPETPLRSTSLKHIFANPSCMAPENLLPLLACAGYLIPAQNPALIDGKVGQKGARRNDAVTDTIDCQRCRSSIASGHGKRTSNCTDIRWDLTDTHGNKEPDITLYGTTCGLPLTQIQAAWIFHSYAVSLFHNMGR